MNQKLRGGIFVFLGACSFGVLSTIVKTAYGEGFNVGQITGTQSFFGMAILWLIYAAQVLFNKSPKSDMSESTVLKITPKWKIICAGSLTGLVGIFYYQAVNLVPASIAIILLMQYLWISILIEWAVFKKKPHRMQVLAAVVVFTGTVFAGGVFNETLHLNTKGIIFGFLAAISYSIFLMTSGRVGNDRPVFQKSALMITGSMILTWIVFPPHFFFDGALIAGLYKWGLLLAVLGTVVPPLFFSIGVPKVGVSLGAILSAAELPVAVLSSHFILKEEVQSLQWLGVLLILGAIVMTNIKVKNRERELIQ